MSDTPALLIQTFERPTTFPTIWNGFGPYMMPPRIAVWFHTRGDYQIYEINRNNYPAIVLTPTNTERTQPFYFVSVDEDAQSRNFTLYKPRARVHTHQQLEGGAGKEGEGEAAAAVATDHLKIGSIFPNPPTVPISPSAQGGLFGGLLQKEWQAPAQRQSRDHTQHKKKG